MSDKSKPLPRARWWMRRRRHPRTFAEYMATPEKIAMRDAMLAMCDQVTSGVRLGELAHDGKPSLLKHLPQR